MTTPSLDPPLRLKGNPFARQDYFRTDVAKGVTRTPSGQRVCTLPSEFLLGFRDALIYECGKAYRKVLKAAGRRWGGQYATRFDRDLVDRYSTRLKDLPAGLVHTCLAESFAAHGYGRLEIDLSQVGSGVVLVDLADAVMPALVRESDRPVDGLMAGMLGAVFAHLAGEPLDAVQTECPSLGADRSRFLVTRADVASSLEDWIDAAETMPTHDAILQRALQAAAAANN